MLLELLRSLIRRRCPAVAQVSTRDFWRCDYGRGHLGRHWAERGMDELYWTEEIR